MQGFERVLANCLSSAIVAHKYIFASRWSDYMHGFVYALALRSSKTFQKKGAIHKYSSLNAPKKENRWHGHTPKRGRKRKGDKRRLKERKVRDS